MKTFLCLLAACVLFGCSKKPAALRNEFFVEWLQRHGETNVVVDFNGVGIAGNKTRMSASLYGVTEKEGLYTAEVEYTIILPSDGPIREFVVGIGPTEEKAVNQAMGNFVLSTAHVVYKAFINSADPHQTMNSVVINGQTRKFFSGDIMTLGKRTNASDELDNNLPGEIQSLISTLPLDSHNHWVKVVYSQAKKKPLLASVSLDNNEIKEMAPAVQNLKWPAEDDLYMMNQFIVIK
jgi:hypothetical protein